MRGAASAEFLNDYRSGHLELAADRGFWRGGGMGHCAVHGEIKWQGLMDSIKWLAPGAAIVTGVLLLSLLTVAAMVTLCNLLDAALR